MILESVLQSPARLLTADRGDAGHRLDLVIRRHLNDVPAATRTRVQAWIADGQVSINGATIRRAAARTAFGDTVAIRLPDGVGVPKSPVAGEDRALDVLYEDEWLLVLNKPSGIVVHPTCRHPASTMLNALMWRARDWAADERPSLVGRLDRLTSGVLVVARSAEAHAALQRSFAADTAEKDYLALVYGHVKPRRGEIALCLRRDPGDRRKIVASPDLGAASVTMFERIDRTRAPRPDLSLVRCRLVTGRTHQVRVHLSASGWPIVGDPVYGEPRWSNVTDPALAAALRSFPRQALHAWRLSVHHPFTRERLVVHAPIPADLGALLGASGLHAPRST